MFPILKPINLKKCPKFKKSENEHNTKLQWIDKRSYYVFQMKKIYRKSFLLLIYIQEYKERKREVLKRQKLLNFIWNITFSKSRESNFRVKSALLDDAQYYQS